MFKNKVSAIILNTFVTPESWLQSTHPLSAAATIAFARLAIHCVEAGNFDETSDIVGCADIQAVQYNPASGRPITLYKATYLVTLLETQKGIQNLQPIPCLNQVALRSLHHVEVGSFNYPDRKIKNR